MLATRHLIERDRCFIQVQHGAGVWDAYGELTANYERSFKAVAGLLKDLNQCGMHASTIVIFATEFGRMPADS